MAFFRNFTNGIDINTVMDDEEGEDFGVGNRLGNEYVNGSLSEKDVQLRIDDAEGSRGDIQGSGVRTNMVGKWGSSFWKDCQPMYNPREAATESGRESKNLDSDYKSDEGSEDNNSLDDMNGRLESGDCEKDGDDVQRSPADVPAEEMLSDDYYEQDGDDQKDDPDDADFEPDDAGVDGGTTNKDEDWNIDDSDEDDENDIDLDMSDDDVEFIGNTRHKGRGKVGGGLKSNGERKSASKHSRQRRLKAPYDDDNSSAVDSEIDSEEDIIGRPKRGKHHRKNMSGRATMSYKSVEQHDEVRTSSRSVRKVSYVESEESEEVDEGKTKNQKDDIDEEDGDSIERVLWHQPKGMAEDALRNHKSIQPSVLSHFLDSDPDWNETEFFIKWKSQSYLHCQWKPFSELRNLTGFKKVMNYTKRVMEERRFRKALSREEVEVRDVSKEMELDLIKQYSQVDRIFADRIRQGDSDDVTPEFLVKWQGLSYAEATWEKDVDIAFAQDAIDEYKAREAAMTVQGKLVDFQRKKSKAMKCGDVPLECWRNDTNVILADEMGLGKTVQSVSMLGFLQNAQQIHGPFLVVVPLSTLSNWAKEFKKWLPDLNVIVYIGNRASREVGKFCMVIYKASCKHIVFSRVSVAR
ncbi:hypothetical protein IFM89_037583 [Coptis chinensis]|uniref:Protein CHROMATIN REMODELING 5 n=1 Tax=Coptis chinensis TaxID=261450 RepID=A0A835H9C6_9MAGN|nr:hypothetical protein IFM89_037583 [Coptis chinensis]